MGKHPIGQNTPCSPPPGGPDTWGGVEARLPNDCLAFGSSLSILGRLLSVCVLHLCACALPRGIFCVRMVECVCVCAICVSSAATADLITPNWRGENTTGRSLAASGPKGSKVSEGQKRQGEFTA